MLTLPALVHSQKLLEHECLSDAGYGYPAAMPSIRSNPSRLTHSFDTSAINHYCLSASRR
ncbi:MAG: hypothetical protein AAF649_01780 [Verrucomicrobiota bacterium]